LSAAELQEHSLRTATLPVINLLNEITHVSITAFAIVEQAAPASPRRNIAPLGSTPPRNYLFPGFRTGRWCLP
jgi:hypothetical protein